MPAGIFLIWAASMLWPAIERVPLPTGAPPERVVSASAPRVRPLDQLATDLIAEGVRRSSTFARVVGGLQRTDVVVYVYTTVRLPPGCDGALRFVAAAGGLRYVHASIDSTKPRYVMIAMIAHELQHALEVAGSPDVRSQDAFRAFFRRVGMGRSLSSWVDSSEARDVGERVRRELAGI